MVEAAKSARINDAERKRLTDVLREKYEKGASLRELAHQTGRSYGFVRRLLSNAGVTLRGRGGATGGSGNSHPGSVQ